MDILRLWNFSNQLEIEIFLGTRIKGSGNRKDVILDKYKDDISEVRSKSRFNSLFMSLILIIPAFIAVSTVNESLNLLGTISIEQIFFTNSIAISSYYLFNLLFMLLFGMMQIANLLEGNVFRFLHTLPFTKREVQILGIMTLIRLLFIQILVMIFALPIGLLIVTRSPLIFLAGFIINFINLIFILYILIILINKLRGVLFAQEKEFSWRSIFRYLIFVFYFLATFSIYFFIGSFSLVLTQLYEFISLPVEVLTYLNYGIPLIPFPFPSSYILTIIALGQIPSPLTLISIAIGFVLSLLLIWKVLAIGNRILLNMAFSKNETAETDRDKNHIVTIESTPPLRSYIKMSVLLILRDVGALMSMTMAVLFPLLPLLQQDGQDPMINFIFYSGFIMFFSNNAFSVSEGSLGSLLSSLPFNHRLMFRGKQLLLSIIYLLGFALLNIVSLGRYLTIEWFFVGTILGFLLPYVFLITKGYFFGKLNNEYTLYTIEDDSSFLRNMFLIIPVIVLAGLEFGLFFVLLAFPSFGEFLLTFAAINTIFFLILETITRRMFR